MGRKMLWEPFLATRLTTNILDGKGRPLHTRYYKKQMQSFHPELKEHFGFDFRKCEICGCDDYHHITGRPFFMELDHINRITNDARIENLRPLCMTCHSQTDGYKNRKITIEQAHAETWGL
jgi:hypothetical protein